MKWFGKPNIPDDVSEIENDTKQVIGAVGVRVVAGPLDIISQAPLFGELVIDGDPDHLSLEPEWDGMIVSVANSLRELADAIEKDDFMKPMIDGMKNHARNCGPECHGECMR